MIWTPSLQGLERESSLSYSVKHELILESSSCIIFFMISNKIIMYFICMVPFIPRLLWIDCQNLWLEQPTWCTDRPVSWGWLCIIPHRDFLQVCLTERQYQKAQTLLVSRQHPSIWDYCRRASIEPPLRLFCFATLALLLFLSFISTKDEMKLNVFFSVKLI